MKFTYRAHCFLKYLCLYIVAVLIGCAASPNKQYQGAYPKSLEALSKKNLQLTEELNKLPEIMDGISSEEEKALNRLLDLYNEDPESFDRTFEIMYQTGMPEVRKYCSPLQALLWLEEDGKYKLAKDIIQKYDLNKLLRISWRSRFTIDEGLHISDDETIYIAKNCINEVDIGPMKQSRKRAYLFSLNMYENEQDENLKKNFLNNIRDKIYLDYKINTRRFNKKGKKIIEKGINKNLKNQRWNNYNTVIERLNSPELVDYYVRYEIEYELYFGNKRLKKDVFKSGRGNCQDISYFVTYCLRKSGYKSTTMLVDSENWGHCRHVVSFYEVNGSYFVIDGSKDDGILGPFISINQSPFKICGPI